MFIITALVCISKAKELVVCPEDQLGAMCRLEQAVETDNQELTITTTVVPNS